VGLPLSSRFWRSASWPSKSFSTLVRPVLLLNKLHTHTLSLLALNCQSPFPEFAQTVGSEWENEREEKEKTQLESQTAPLKVHSCTQRRSETPLFRGSFAKLAVKMSSQTHDYLFAASWGETQKCVLCSQMRSQNVADNIFAVKTHTSVFQTKSCVS
jgi:hypothetical protein